jgi:hypothetical protein
VGTIGAGDRVYVRAVDRAGDRADDETEANKPAGSFLTAVPQGNFLHPFPTAPTAMKPVPNARLSELPRTLLR